MMARPIDYMPEPPVVEAAKNDMDETLRALHDAGVLRLIRGLTDNRDGVAQVTADQLNSESGRRLLGNGLLVGKTLASVDPAALSTVLEGTTQGIEQAAKTRDQPALGVWGLFKFALSADVRRGLVLVLTVLAAIGRGSRPS
jgi:uncharacterized protein YjgD (DUF1641 family)